MSTVAVNLQLNSQNFVSGAGQANSAFDRLKRNLTSATPGLGGFLGGLSIVGAFKFGESILEVEKAFQTVERTLAVASGPAKVAEEMEYARKVAESLGLSVLDASQGYAKMSAAAQLSGASAEDTKRAYEGVATASAAMGLSADKTKEALNAVEQMFSKGKISAEELRGQLGERIPGAVAIMAKAVGVSTDELGKMMEQGKLTTEVMGKFGDELKRAFGSGVNTNGLSSQLNKLKSAFDDFRRSIAKTGFVDVVGGTLAGAGTKALNTASKGGLGSVLAPIQENPQAAVGAAAAAGFLTLVTAASAALTVLSSAVGGLTLGLSAVGSLLVGSIVSKLTQVEDGIEFMVNTMREGAANILKTATVQLSTDDNYNPKEAFKGLVDTFVGLTNIISTVIGGMKRFSEALLGATNASKQAADDQSYVSSILLVVRTILDSVTTGFEMAASVIAAAVRFVLGPITSGWKALQALASGDGLMKTVDTLKTDLKNDAEAFISSMKRAFDAPQKLLDRVVSNIEETTGIAGAERESDRLDKLTLDPKALAEKRAQAEAYAQEKYMEGVRARERAEQNAAAAVKKMMEEVNQAAQASMNKATDYSGYKDPQMLAGYKLLEEYKAQDKEKRETKTWQWNKEIADRLIAQGKARYEEQMKAPRKAQEKAIAEQSDAIKEMRRKRERLDDAPMAYKFRLGEFTEGFGQARFRRIAELGASKENERLETHRKVLEKSIETAEEQRDDMITVLREIRDGNKLQPAEIP